MLLFWRACLFLNAMPQDPLPKGVAAAVEGVERDIDFLRLVSQPFAALPSKYVDYSVIAYTRRPLLCPPTLGGTTCAREQRSGQSAPRMSAETSKRAMPSPSIQNSSTCLRTDRCDLAGLRGSPYSRDD